MTAPYVYNEIEPIIRRKLVDDLGPNLAVYTEEIDEGRVYVKVIGDKFDGLTEAAKQRKVWKTLRQLGPIEKAVGLVLTFGLDEL